MKIGYPCVNEAMDCSAGNTFRLASYSEERLVAAVTANLACLRRMLEWNVAQGLLFFRIGSGIVPFGSHPVNTFPWQTHFAAEFRAIGDYIKANNLRVSFHPDQFVVLNSPSPDIVQRSIQELVYQGSMLDLMGLDGTAKLQIHVGGLYGERELAISRFAAVHATLPAAVKARVVVENDDRLFPLRDCLHLHQLTGVPILFDNFHHECLNHGEPMAEALRLAAATWHPTADGVPMMDYSSQALGERKGKHTDDLVDDLFREFPRPPARPGYGPDAGNQKQGSQRPARRGHSARAGPERRRAPTCPARPSRCRPTPTRPPKAKRAKKAVNS